MIRPLRRLHRAAFLLLAVALPLLVALALIQRPAAPVSRLPASIGPAR